MTSLLDPPNNPLYFDNRVEKNYKKVVNSEENIADNFESGLT